MRKVTLYMILAFMVAPIFVSCYQSHKKELGVAYALAETEPDSALAFLNHIEQRKLSEEDMAKYALIYYMAQDKSGLNVDNDSLIRIAYDWYEEHQNDSLYATALYYMGEYYRLVDSIVLAKACLEKSYNLVKKKDDDYLISLSLDKLVRVEGELNPHKAMKLARNLVEFYDKRPQLPLKNKVYARLRLSTSLLDIDSLHSALDENLLALNDAKALKNKEVMSDVCQDLAFVYGELGKKDSSLYYAKIASSQRNPEDVTCQLELAFAFYDVDSLNEMFAILNNLSPKSREDKNSILYLKTLGAIKNKNINLAICYTDSASDNYENAYRKAVQGKYNYYASYINNVKEKAELKGKAKMQRWVLLPFFRTDGYWILADFLNEPNLYNKSWDMVKDKIFCKKELGSSEKRCLAYFFITEGFVVVTLILYMFSNFTFLLSMPHYAMDFVQKMKDGDFNIFLNLQLKDVWNILFFYIICKKLFCIVNVYLFKCYTKGVV